MLYSIKRFTHLAVPLGAALLLGLWDGGATAQVVADDVDCAGCVGKGDIADKAVTARKIKSNSIFSPKIVNRSIQGIDIGLGAVGTQEIADEAVTLDKLAPDAAAVIAGSPNPVTVNVNCGAGDSVQDAVDAAVSGQGTTILISGVCNENVLILKDRITLQGVNPASSQIVGVPETDPFVESPIALIGAQLVVIDNLTVSDGQSSGITATSSFFTVSNSVVENHGASGIVASAGSTARIDNNTIQGNAQQGISVGASFAQVTNNVIQSNDRNGISVFPGGNALIGETLGGTVGPNTISENENGIRAVNFGYASIHNNTIEDNTFHGVFSHLGGSVRLSDNLVRRNGTYGLFVNEGSNGRLDGGNTIESDAEDYNVGAVVAVYRSSSLRIRGDNTLRNNAPRFITDDSGAAGGFALDIEMVSSLRQDGGHTTIVGNIESFNQTTVDLRNVDITGSLYADGLDGNLRLRDQSQPSANVTLAGGNLYTFGDPVSIRGPGSAQQPIFQGNIDCGGSFVFINSPNFGAGFGFVNCPGIP